MNWCLKLKLEDFLFPSRLHHSPHVSTWQYARIVGQWVTAAGLDPAAYGTHSMQRTKATLIPAVDGNDGEGFFAVEKVRFVADLDGSDGGGDGGIK